MHMVSYVLVIDKNEALQHHRCVCTVGISQGCVGCQKVYRMLHSIVCVYSHTLQHHKCVQTVRISRVCVGCQNIY